MATLEASRHDILLIVVTVLFILFATGLVVPGVVTPTPIIIP